MEMVVGVEGSKELEGNFVDKAADEFGSCSAPSKQVTDPVVYKLVRVDFDGRLVPATDDELMEVENLLELEKSDILSVSDVVDAVGQDLDKDEASEKTSQEFTGSSQIKNAKVDEEKLNSQLEESLPTSSLSPNKTLPDESTNNAESSNLKLRLNKSGSYGSKPNFSLLKGEVNLDKLTIRELQETFRAAFGRETSVKDKMWLKRRIAMGLTNSCEVSVTSFIIKDGKLVVNEETCKNPDHDDPVTGEVCSEGDDIPVASCQKIEDTVESSELRRSDDLLQVQRGGKRVRKPTKRYSEGEDIPVASCQKMMEDTVESSELRNDLAESGHRSDDMLEAQRGGKRVRKPTKRYIEELSDNETKECSSRKHMPLTKHLEQPKASSVSPVRYALTAYTGSMVTRPDSIGGSGIRVPYVSRIRRCRPRKSVAALTNFQPSEEAMMRKISDCTDPQPCCLGGDEVTEPKTDLLKETQVLPSEEEKENRCLTGMSDVSQDREPAEKDSQGNNDNITSRDCMGDANSDDKSVAGVKGGMRRKHHRAWTLTEVVKLVDGVSKFGAGRWSEIKRLSFSSHSHRTSVDLKDKWRNLLKASFANPSSDKGQVNPRKNVPSPIPAPILMKVRELAEMNGQVQVQMQRSLKAGGESEDNCSRGSTVNDNRSGFL